MILYGESPPLKPSLTLLHCLFDSIIVLLTSTLNAASVAISVEARSKTRRRDLVGFAVMLDNIINPVDKNIYITFTGFWAII